MGSDLIVPVHVHAIKGPNHALPWYVHILFHQIERWVSNKQLIVSWFWDHTMAGSSPGMVLRDGQ